MIDLFKKFGRDGYLIVESPSDTTNIVCQRGHIYADGDFLVASMDHATVAESAKLRKLGTPLMDGDFGELSIKFDPKEIRNVARILKPKQRQNRFLAA
jgi:hypothetical protein